MENLLSYPTDPITITLTDRVPRQVRYTADALRRLQKAAKALGPEPGPMDALVCQLWEGLIDRRDIVAEYTDPDTQEVKQVKGKEALYYLIEGRYIAPLAQELASLVKESQPETDPPKPASAS